MRARHGLRWSRGVGSSHRSPERATRSMPGRGSRTGRRARAGGRRTSARCRWPAGRRGVARRAARGTVDAADEGHVVGLVPRMPDQHHLLVMRTGPADPLVQQDLAPRLVDRLGEVDRLLLAEVCLVRVRPPHRPARRRPARPGRRGRSPARCPESRRAARRRRPASRSATGGRPRPGPSTCPAGTGSTRRAPAPAPGCPRSTPRRHRRPRPPRPRGRRRCGCRGCRSAAVRNQAATSSAGGGPMPLGMPVRTPGHVAARRRHRRC